jgi:hypothetical protein
MHIRRLAALLLGGWLAVSLAVLLLATQNFRTVDRLLKSPPAEAAQAIQNLGQAQAGALLRHAASEQNRSSSEAWEEVQLIWGGVLLLVMLWGKHRDLRGLLPAVLMLATVAVMHWFLTPEIARLGRVVDFIPTDQPSPDRTRLWNFHVAYSTAEAVKLLLGAVQAGVLLLHRKSPSGRRERDIAPAVIQD